ncbi:tobamovirus multiplication protein 1 isoform X2 [Cicer arietinum]|uniref:Tobamovirus multiplication protein 1 isoform X2 n=1 Tax=Cicer arietinum TaxID=3827 RepID=A0A1S2XP45_CICAR|nr:tobamovirus multiplication protein 1 isoform X2 [Cicer arietinum]
MKEDWNCFTLDLIFFNVALACIDGFLAFIAFAQVLRIHMRSQQNDWTRQKVLHIMIGTSNLGYCIYFTSTVFATCNGWICWSGACGFILMASPKVMFLAAFLLLLSFWVDLCHQENEEEFEEEEDNVENRTQQALLEGIMRENGSDPMKSHRRCCSVQRIHIGIRQKYVIMVVVLIFVVMMAFAILICVGNDRNPIDPSIVARVYETFLAVMTLILAGALGCYGLLLFFKLRKVRSETASSEMWKVASLAIISIICFSSSALVALNTDIPLFYHWHLKFIYGVKAFIFLILYYFIGSSLPSAYLLWIIRELPPPVTDSKQEEPRRTFTFISHAYETSDSNHPLSWATATSSKNQMSRASPI